MGVLALAIIVVGLVVWRFLPAAPGSAKEPSTPSSASKPPTPSSPAPPLTTNQVASSLMVTVELDADKNVGIREALKDMERRYEPDSGSGRTFAVLDAYGERNPAGKLHLSMHLSMERPGLGSLVSRRTGEVHWRARIVPRPGPPPGEKSLTIVMEDAQMKQTMLDGSKGAAHVLDVPLSGTNVTARQVWPDGEEREFIFTYSTCGCPVHAKVRRVGETTMRTSDMPVMFPDDPEALLLIHQIMGWGTVER
jgi:hypothetical protein